MRGSAGAENNNWRGGRIVEPRGYVLLRLPDHPNADVRGYVYEHVVVMAEHLGRALVPPEVVHHVSEDHGDNRIDNLVLCASRSEHAALHRSSTCPAGHADWYHRKDGGRSCRECRRIRRAKGPA